MSKLIKKYNDYANMQDFICSSAGRIVEVCVCDKSQIVPTPPPLKYVKSIVY